MVFNGWDKKINLKAEVVNPRPPSRKGNFIQCSIGLYIQKCALVSLILMPFRPQKVALALV